MNKKLIILNFLLTMLFFGCNSSEVNTTTLPTETENTKPASVFTQEPTEDHTSEPIIIPITRTFMVGHNFYNGPGYFKFALIDWTGITWSNDGAEPPITSVPLTVSKGNFTVDLGDSSVEGMTQSITKDAFKNKIIFLQTWFSTDEVNWEQLPDQKIPVPMALQDAEIPDSDVEETASTAEFPTGMFVHETKKNETLQFNEDGSYIVWLNGRIDITGSYTTDGNRYIDDTNWARCTETPTGTYSWTYFGTWLTFEMVGDDQCDGRREDMDGITWFKVEENAEQ